MEPSPRIEKEEVWYVFVLRESLPVGVTPWHVAKSESPPYWFWSGSKASNPFDLKYFPASVQVQRFVLTLTYRGIRAAVLRGQYQ